MNDISQEFGKHYASMYTGSMVGAGARAFAVMGYVISSQRPVVNSDDMFVELNPKLLAFIIGEKEADIESAIEFLCRPDKRSRSKEEDGRRLVRVGEFIYRVVNGRKYRQMGIKQRRMEQNRAAQARHRQKARERQAKEDANKSRERRFVEAEKNGDQEAADRIVSEGLPGAAVANQESPPDAPK